MKQISDQALEDLAELRDLKVKALARDGGCRAAAIVPEVRCRGRYDLDHLKSKGRGGAKLSIDNVIILCRAHHEWKGAHPDEANARGLWPHSWEEASAAVDNGGLPIIDWWETP